MTAMAQVEVLRAACCIAGADGTVDENERAFVDGLAERVGVGKASLDAMVLRAETEPEFFKQQFKVLKSNPKATMGTLFQAAASSGKLESKEIDMLQAFAVRLGMDGDGFREVATPVIEALKKSQ